MRAQAVRPGIMRFVLTMRYGDGRSLHRQWLPSPGFTYYQEASKQHINEAIARLLARCSPS